MAKQKKNLTRWFSEDLIGIERWRVLSLFFLKERKFLYLIITLFIVAGVFYDYPRIAMWIGFAFAGYSAIANDSIQTIGTFLASNAKQKWYHLWLFIGSIFLVTVWYSWYTFAGDVSYQRLTTKGFEKAPETFMFLQVAAPLVLLILTRLRMPVSTTFLLLSSFSTSSDGILGVAQKSISGYGIAFLGSLFIWFVFAKLIKRFTEGEPKPIWTVLQWIISGALWASWIMQDAANIAIYLPRALSVWEFVAFASFIFLGLGILFYLRGDKIQKIVNDKSEVKDVRGASVIDLVYTIILLIFQSYSKIPMSTTWVFLGLLGGREVAMALSGRYETKNTMKKVFGMIGKDAFYATLGLIISIILAFLVNPNLQTEFIEYLGW